MHEVSRSGYRVILGESVHQLDFLREYYPKLLSKVKNSEKMEQLVVISPFEIELKIQFSLHRTKPQHKITSRNM